MPIGSRGGLRCLAVLCTPAGWESVSRSPVPHWCGCTLTDGGGAGGGGWFGGSSRTGGGGSGFINTLSTSGSFPGGLNKGDGKVIITTG